MCTQRGAYKHVRIQNIFSGWGVRGIIWYFFGGGGAEESEDYLCEFLFHEFNIKSTLGAWRFRIPSPRPTPFLRMLKTGNKNSQIFTWSQHKFRRKKPLSEKKIQGISHHLNINTNFTKLNRISTPIRWDAMKISIWVHLITSENV